MLIQHLQALGRRTSLRALRVLLMLFKLEEIVIFDTCLNHVAVHVGHSASGLRQQALCKSQEHQRPDSLGRVMEPQCPNQLFNRFLCFSFV